MLTSWTRAQHTPGSRLRFEILSFHWRPDESSSNQSVTSLRSNKTPLRCSKPWMKINSDLLEVWHKTRHKLKLDKQISGIMAQLAFEAKNEEWQEDVVRQCIALCCTVRGSTIVWGFRHVLQLSLNLAHFFFSGYRFVLSYGFMHVTT